MFSESTPRRRLPRRAWIAGAAAAALAVPGAVYGLTAHHGSTPRPVRVGAGLATGTDFHAYVSAIGNNLAEFDTTSGAFLADLSLRDSIGSTVLDSPFGVAATPDGSQVFVADQGKSNVLAVATATNTLTQIELGGGPPPGTTTAPLPANPLSSASFPESRSNKRTRPPSARKAGE